MFDEQSAPDLQAARNMRLSVRIKAQPRSEQHHVGIGAENRARRAGAGNLATDGLIEALQTVGISEIIQHRSVGGIIRDSLEGIEVAGQPAVVLGDQTFEEQADRKSVVEGRWG